MTKEFQRMGTNASKILQERVSTFVKWIETENEREEEIRVQSDEIRSRIKGQAVDDGLVVRSTPAAGSFAKHTGLRRHLLGDSDVEGQDVDLPFVVSPQTADGERLAELLKRFDGYAQRSYPTTAREVTQSCVRLEFVSTKLNYDLVPMLATTRPDEQIILRADGDRRRTSVQKHIEFIKLRTTKTNKDPSGVQFNEMVRLIKWWKEFRVSKGGVLSADEIPTFLLDLLSAAAFDQVGVRATYVETLHAWFGWLSNMVGSRKPIGFTDFTAKPARTTAKWDVIDPVNAENNVASRLSGPQVDELADWFARGRDRLAGALAANRDGDDVRALGQMVELLGSPFSNHCDEE